MRVLKLILSLSVGLAIVVPSLRAEAGAEGHGGMGIYVNNQLYLLDLVEAGVQDNPTFDTSITPRADYITRVTAALNRVFPPGSQEISLIASKLTEIATVSNSLSESLIIGMSLYSWTVIDQKLISPHDDHTPIAHSPGDLVPLAIRRDQAIMLSRQNIALLPVTNRAGLIFHEIGFGFVTPTSVSPNGPYVQDSARAKEFTGFILSHSITQQTLAALGSVVSSLNLPTYQASLIRWNSSDGYSSFDTDPYIYVTSPELPELSSGGFGYTPSRGFYPVWGLVSSPSELCAALSNFHSFVVSSLFTSKELSVTFANYIGEDQASHDYLKVTTFDYHKGDDRSIGDNLDHLNHPVSNVECMNLVTSSVNSLKGLFDSFKPY